MALTAAGLQYYSNTDENVRSIGVEICEPPFMLEICVFF